MRLFALLVAFLMTAPVLAKESGFKVAKVDAVAQWLEAKQAFVFDANSDDVRMKQGIVPGATVLASYDKYDVAKVLPADKNAKLVFYCANTQCTASHDAAKLAMTSGYKEVYVMSEGIAGWKKAGKTAQKYDKKS